MYIYIYIYTGGIKKSREFIKKNVTNEHLKKDVVQQPKDGWWTQKEAGSLPKSRSTVYDDINDICMMW